MKPITAIVIGAGERGVRAYAPYALINPHRLQIIGVAEPNKEKRISFKDAYSLKNEMVFESAEKLYENSRLADCVFICTPDSMHYEHTLGAIEKGYHILLEKPMGINAEQCVRICREVEKKDVTLAVCHVLRYTSFFMAIKELLDKGKIGDIISIAHNENVAHWHHAHSFVRGNWRNSNTSSPMILAKSCHDMDILLWLVDSGCKQVSSFGSLLHFKSENAPGGAPKRCLDGCPHEYDCPYNAAKFYLTDNTDSPFITIVSTDHSIEGRTRALKEGPYGLCVYHCDNNVVDHQVVNLEFENGVTIAFTMCAFTLDCCRTIKIMGTKGEIRGHMENNEIEVSLFSSKRKEYIAVSGDDEYIGHGGGDLGLIADFVDLLDKGELNSKTSAANSLDSHLLAFAAEQSRLSGKTVDYMEFRDSVEQGL